MLYEYDELGNQTRSGLDLNLNGTLDLSSMDRITDSSSAYEKTGADWFGVSAQTVYATDTDATPTVTRTQRTRLTGLSPALASESISLDINGNPTVGRTSVNRATKTVTQTVHSPASSVDQTSVTVNGRLMSQTGRSGAVTTFEYDALGRQIAVIDPHTGRSTTQYDAAGRATSVTDAAGKTTTFGYDATTGRKISQTDPLGTVTHYAYDIHGQMLATWGGTYPVAYEYDEFNRMTAMYTLRNTAVTISDQSSFITYRSSFDKTTWSYDLATGLLLSKTDASGKSVPYTYYRKIRLDFGYATAFSTMPTSFSGKSGMAIMGLSLAGILSGSI